MTKDLDYYLNLPYEIIVKKLTDEEGGGYLARYKDYPYIMGDGENEAEAIADAKSAFLGALKLMLAKGDFIREPETKSVRVNISLPKSLLEAIDKVASNRSAFLANAANKALMQG